MMIRSGIFLWAEQPPGSCRVRKGRVRNMTILASCSACGRYVWYHQDWCALGSNICSRRSLTKESQRRENRSSFLAEMSELLRKAGLTEEEEHDKDNCQTATDTSTGYHQVLLTGLQVEKALEGRGLQTHVPPVPQGEVPDLVLPCHSQGFCFLLFS